MQAADGNITISLRELIEITAEKTAETIARRFMDEHEKRMHPVPMHKFWFILGMLAAGGAGAALARLL